MRGARGLGLTSVKRSFIRDPWLVAGGAAALGALLALNVAAVLRGLESPWLLGTAVVADILAVGLGILVAAREVMVADRRSDESQERLAAILDSAMDAVITVDEAHSIVLFNRAAEQVFGCRREEALGSSLERFLPQRFRSAHRGHIDHFGRTGVTARRMGDVTTLWALRANGTEFPIEASISQATQDGRRYYTVILRDITRRRQAEQAAQQHREELQQLSAQVLEAREEEKTRIARELHDELGQMLTALKMDLGWLRGRLAGGDAEVSAKAAAMEEVLDRTVGATRRIAADLRPLMLDDLGLAEAAQWLVGDFSQRSGVQARIQTEGAERLENLERAVANTLYRALQESLTNIARHAGASNAWVMLAADGERIRLEIEDDGRGIAPEDFAKLRSLGLKGMRERVHYIGGTIDISRAPRGGTRLHLSVPLRQAAEARS